MFTEDRFIDLHKVREITSLGKTAIYNLIATGELRPVKLGKKTVFSQQEIYAWVARKLAERPAPDAPDN